MVMSGKCGSLEELWRDPAVACRRSSEVARSNRIMSSSNGDKIWCVDREFSKLNGAQWLDPLLVRS
jgi:hypothetical protein